MNSFISSPQRKTQSIPFGSCLVSAWWMCAVPRGFLGSRADHCFLFLQYLFLATMTTFQMIYKTCCFKSGSPSPLLETLVPRVANTSSVTVKTTRDAMLCAPPINTTPNPSQSSPCAYWQITDQLWCYLLYSSVLSKNCCTNRFLVWCKSYWKIQCLPFV